MKHKTLHCARKPGNVCKQARRGLYSPQKLTNITAWLGRMAALANCAKQQDIMPATAKG